MSIHDHLKHIPASGTEKLGWSRALELAKVARSEGRHFGCATWLHKAKEWTKEELKEEVYKEVRSPGRLCDVGSSGSPAGEKVP
jgi:hypothetical protein